MEEGPFLMDWTAEVAPVTAETVQLMHAALGGGVQEDKGEPQATLREHLRQVDPGPHLDWWHVGAMIEACQAVLDGEVERLLIMAPPRTFKSRTVVQGATSCHLRRDPRSKIFVTCADDKLVRYHGRNAKKFCVRAGVEVTSDAKAADWWETAQGGVYRAVTIRSGMQGVGWDLGVVDDPFRSRMEAQNRLRQEEVWDLFRGDFMTRKQGRPNGTAPGLIVMHQRLAVSDMAGKVLVFCDEKGEEWTVLCLRGYAERSPVVVPASCRLIPDPRQPGEPLCEDREMMSVISERRHTDPHLSRAIDQQDPTEDAGGGVFCRSWFRVVGQGLPDLHSSDAVVRIGLNGALLPAQSRRGRGWDFNAGGADKTACALGGPIGEMWLWEHAAEYSPEPAALEKLVIDTAEADGQGVEIVLPNEIAVGKVFSDRLAGELRRQGYRVLGMPQREGKLPRSIPHAGKAAALCHACHKFIVPEEAVEMFSAQGVCECETPDGDGYGGVLLLAGPWNTMAADRLHGFTGEPGGADDLADAMAVCFNALSPPPGKWFFGSAGGETKPTALGALMIENS